MLKIDEMCSRIPAAYYGGLLSTDELSSSRYGPRVLGILRIPRREIARGMRRKEKKRRRRKFRSAKCRSARIREIVMHLSRRRARHLD